VQHPDTPTVMMREADLNRPGTQPSKDH